MNVNNDFEKNIYNFIVKHIKFENSNLRFLIGLSGGADSVSLLFGLYNVIKKNVFKNNIELIGIHYNHNQRGEKSDEDEFFCKELCEKLNVKFYSEKYPEHKDLSENEARNLRFQFYRRAKDRFKTEIIFLAHNKNDQVETFLYRLFKGTSTYGLRAIWEVKNNLDLICYRPLLSIERVEIENYLKSLNQNYVIDQTNLENKFKRNYIRNKIMPLIENINPNFQNSIINLISNINMEQNFLDFSLTKNYKTQINKNTKYDTQQFLKLDCALQYRFIFHLYKSINLDYDYKKIKNMLDFIIKNSKLSCGKTYTISKNLFLYVNKKMFYIFIPQMREYCEFSINNLEKTVNFDGYKIKFEKINYNEIKFPINNPYEPIVSFEKINLPLTIRYRKPFDIFQPFGLKEGKMKLKKYFINKHIEKHKRDKIILFAKNNEILYLYGCTISEKLRVKKDSKEIYRIKIEWSEKNE